MRLRIFLSLLFGLQPLLAANRPNILWLTFEDCSAANFGAYGNSDIKTPNFDRLAAEGIRFHLAWSNGTQCSPARSTLISGSYATRFGTENHRRTYEVPPEFTFYPPLLRALGYFATNCNKTDYNARSENIWDENSRSATYHSLKRKPGQPFFAVFNADNTHMSRMRSLTLDGRRDFAATAGLDPAKLTLPPHVPDLPEIRSDYAMHLEGVQDIDRWIGTFLDDLRNNNLADDTIVFIFSDHGGCLPRGKGFTFDTGLRVPLVVYFPEKWKHLAGPGYTFGQPSPRLVSFVDFAPTLLSLLGEKAPAAMQGRAFFGPHAAPPRDHLIGFTGNQANHFDPTRAITDGKFHYVRNFIPRKPYCLRNSFQWGMPSNLALDAAQLSGQLAPTFSSALYAPRPAELLFDLEQDPYCTRNLAGDPTHAATKTRLASALLEHMRTTGDLGLFPFEQRTHGKTPLPTWVSQQNISLDQLLNLAVQTSQPVPENRRTFEQFLAHKQPVFRFWAAQGLAELARLGLLKKAPPALTAAAQDPADEIAATAAEALFYLGETAPARDTLAKLLVAKSATAASSLETLTWQPTHAAELQPLVTQLRTLTQGQGAVSYSARSLLVNLKQLPIDELYSANERKGGPAINANIRPISPDPITGGKPNTAEAYPAE